ncbi:MAG: TolC family protein [Alphaproteobacteria bacterium]
MAAVFGLGLVSAGLPANGESLADAIALAYKSNPQVLIARSNLRNADETYFRSTIALVDPTVTVASVTATLSDSQDLLHGGNDTGGSLNIGLSGVTVAQTLFSGGRIATGMDSARNTLMTQRENWRAAEMNLLSTVVNAYTGVRQAEAAYNVGLSSLAIQKKAADDSQAKYEVGTSTISDLKTTQANLAAQQASVLTQQNALVQARNTYLTAVGQLPGTLSQEPEPALRAFPPAGRSGCPSSPTAEKCESQ